MSESVEQICRDLLWVAINDSLVGWCDDEYENGDPQVRSAGELVGMANLLASHLKERTMPDDERDDAPELLRPARTTTADSIASYLEDDEPEFSIAGPGEYITRDGRKATVEFKLPGDVDRCWVGWIAVTTITPDTWDIDGYWYKDEATSESDIVGPWVEPRKPVECWGVVNSGSGQLEHACVYEANANEIASRSGGRNVIVVKLVEEPKEN